MSYIEINAAEKELFEKEHHRISVFRCCEEWCNPNKKTERRTRAYNSLHFIIGGKGTLIYDSDGEKHAVVLQKGDSFLLFAGENYEYYPDGEHPWGYDWIDFTGENVEDIFSACGYETGKPYIHVRNFSKMLALLGNLIDSYDMSDMRNLRCSGYFLILLSYLIDDMRRALSSQEEARSKRFQRLRNILIYINNNYRRDLSVDAIARDVCVSPDYLKHLFSDFLNMPLTEYLNRFRISAACEEFRRNAEVSIGEVAFAAGYSDPKYFARIFRKIKGMSASEYRKVCADDDPFTWLKGKNIDYR